MLDGDRDEDGDLSDVRGDDFWICNELMNE